MATGVSSVELAPGIECGGGTFPFIAGPCVIESREQALETGRLVASIAARLEAPFIFKASFDKANRSSIKSFRGPGLEEGLAVLAEIKRETGLPLTTDVHHPEQCAAVARVCDVLQIPAFLCRQSDLVLAAAATGRAVTIKKGQFMAPADMRLVVEKARSAGNPKVAVIERGHSFGYNNLVVDMRSFALLHEHGIPVIYDATHSLQLPGGEGEQTGGDRRFAGPLARAAVAAGADGVFMEIHPRPNEALSDRATQLDPARGEELAASLLAIRRGLTAPSDQPARV